MRIIGKAVGKYCKEESNGRIGMDEIFINLAKLRKKRKALADMRRHKNSSSGLGNWGTH
jgi:hypothetical protein